DLADGVVRNEDGTLNDAQHPAAVGSTITLFATGMGATKHPLIPGSIADSNVTIPVRPVYSTWDYGPAAPPDPVSSVPGFLAALSKSRAKVPVAASSPPQSVTRASVGVLFQPQVYPYPSVSNVVAVYVK